MNSDGNNPDCGETQELSPRPIFSNYVRDLAPYIARRAIFIITIGPAEDYREHHKKSVAGCEGASCAIPAKAAEDRHIAPLEPPAAEFEVGR
jgi:hypothetical protein